MNYPLGRYNVKTTLELTAKGFRCTYTLIPRWYRISKLDAGELAGTLHLQRVRCGKQNCKCTSTREEDAHTAWYRLWRDGTQRQRKTYVKRSELATVRKAIERRQARVRREQEERRAHMRSGRHVRPCTPEEREHILDVAVGTLEACLLCR